MIFKLNRDKNQNIKKNTEKDGNYLFGSKDTITETFISDTKSHYLKEYQSKLLIVIQTKGQISYEYLLEEALQYIMIWAEDLNSELLDLKEKELIEIIGFKKKERTPKKGHIIKWIA